MASQNNRILIVDNDNDEEGGNIVACVPERAGYHPRTTRTTWIGLEALEILKSEDFHLLLVSNCLPDPYVEDFHARLGSSPKQACSIAVQEDQFRATTLLKLKSMIEEERRRPN